MNDLSEFVGLFPVSKTIKWELKPVGKEGRIHCCEIYGRPLLPRVHR